MSQTGSTILRKEIVDGVIKGRANASYKFKQAVSISTTSAWDNSFYRESSAALVSQVGYPGKIPRGGNFPQASVEWTKHIKTIEKYGLEDNIIWEDNIAIDVSHEFNDDMLPEVIIEQFKRENNIRFIEGKSYQKLLYESILGKNIKV